MSDEPERLYDTTRRAFMKTTAAVGVAGAGIGVGAGGVAAQATTFRFDGEVSGWIGRAPSRIEGKTNPTLNLEPGKEYVFFWENTDGLPHNVVISDGDGNNFVRSDIISEQGATQRVQFTAKEGMSTYYCEVHPSSMRGNVKAGAAETTQAGGGAGPRFVEEGRSVGLQKVADGPLQQPVGFTYAEEDRDRRFILDQNGYIYVHGSNGLREEPFLDIHDRLYYLTKTKGGYPRPEEGHFDERGLIGLAFHPNFAENGKFYVHYSAPPKQNMSEYVGPSGRQLPPVVDHTLRISEFQATDDGSKANLESERVILEVPEPQFNHNAGDMAFGPDGYLYVTVADGGGANDAFKGHVQDWYDGNAGGNGQDVKQNLLGSILRIDVDSKEGDLPYGIPDDNPLVGKEGLDEQYAWGFRNPWRISFNDGRLYAADVGQALFEEVNIVQKGGNYGWNVKEGTHCFSVKSPAQPPENCPTSVPNDVRGGEQFVDPVIQYPHTYKGTQVGTSVTGGYLYQGNALSDLKGQYVFGDWSTSFNAPQGRLFVSTPGTTGGSDSTWKIRELVIEGSENGDINRFIPAFGRDRNGEVYVLTSTEGGVKGQGAVYKIVPPGQGEQISPVTQQEPPQTEAEQGTDVTTLPQSGIEENATGTTDAAMGDGTATSEGEAGSVTENNEGQPGFGALAALAGVGVGAASLLRRGDDEEE